MDIVNHDNTIKSKKPYSESGSLDFTPTDEFTGSQLMEVTPEVVAAAAGIEAASEKNPTSDGAVLFGSPSAALIWGAKENGKIGKFAASKLTPFNAAVSEPALW